MIDIDSIETLEEAKQLLRDNWEQGIKCPCCGQWVKRYPYKLNSNAAVSLIWIYRLGLDEKDGWVHVQQRFTEVFNRNATAMSYIVLKHWGFIEPKPNNLDPDKNASGYWRITTRGINFVLHGTKEPTHAHVYNNRAVGFAEEYADIKQALGVKFSYAELMQ